MKSIHLWAPSFDPAQGGIQSYSFELSEALARDVTVRTFFRVGQSGALFALKATLGAFLQRPDFIISTHLNFGPLALAMKRCLGTRYAISLHGIEAWSAPSASRLQALKQADILLSVSRHTQDRARALIDPSGARWELLPNTFDEARFRPGPRPASLMAQWGITNSQPVILSVGRMDQREAYKGQDKILFALPAVLREIPECICIFVGDGDDRARLEKIVSDLGLQKNVLFAGKVADAVLPDYYRLCDVFALPSSGEGFGITFLEALASGRPVVAGNADAAREVLRDGELGLLVDPGHPDALAAALLSCLRKRQSFPPGILREKAIAYYGRPAFRRRLVEIFEL